MNLRFYLSLGLPAAMISSLPAVEWTGNVDNDFNSILNWNLVKPFYLLGAGSSAEFTQSASPTLSDSLTTPSLEISVSSTVNLSTGVNTLTVKDVILSLDPLNILDDTNLLVEANSTLNFSGNLEGGGGNLDLDVAGQAAFTGSINGAGNDIDLFGGGETTLTDTTVSNLTALNLTGNSKLTLVGNTTIGDDVSVDAGSSLQGSGTVDGNLSIDGNLSPGDAGAGTITVGGNLSGNGTWVFDAVSSAPTDLVSVGGNLDVSGFDLNLSGLTASTNSNNPVIIANYGSFAGGAFNSVSGLLPGQAIDYNFNDSGMVAIVPEVTHFLPLFLAFLPLVSRRNRNSRGQGPSLG